MNTPVSFEIAKLLTHTDFNQKSVNKGYMIATGEESSDYTIDYINAKAIAAPTIADVVMWIYEKHGIWIISKKVNGLNKWFAQIYNNNSNDLCDTNIINISPTETYLAAIEHTLNNLI